MLNALLSRFDSAAVGSFIQRNTNKERAKQKQEIKKIQQTRKQNKKTKKLKGNNK